ncbi:MAG: hypothetical protein HY562_12665 [Ignavibacteriales bacterium]|nr:hypothetical protein [Ignavibacteriales bacterium]
MADSFEELFPKQLHAYMVEFDIPPLSEEIVALIPKQRLAVGVMMGAGTLLNYTLSADRRKLWAVVLGKSSEEIKEELQKFPLTRFMEYRIHELMFHEAATAGISKVSLN